MSAKNELGSIATSLVAKSAFGAVLIDKLPHSGVLESRMFVSAALGLLHYPLVRSGTQMGFGEEESKERTALGSLFVGLNSFLIPEVLRSPAISVGMKLAVIGLLGIVEVTSLFGARQLEKMKKI